jgi:hypothetical protein
VDKRRVYEGERLEEDIPTVARVLKRLHYLSDEGTVLTGSIDMLLSASSGSQRLPVFGYSPL